MPTDPYSLPTPGSSYNAWGDQLNALLTAMRNGTDPTSVASQSALIAQQTAVYDSGWITVQASTGSATWTVPDGTVVVIPKFANNWTHSDASNPVQFRRRGTQVFWRGSASRSSGAPTQDEVMVGGLSYLLPTARSVAKICGTGGFNTTPGAVICSGGGSGYSIRWESGASSFFGLEFDYFAEN